MALYLIIVDSDKKLPTNLIRKHSGFYVVSNVTRSTVFTTPYPS